jgi:hypothetical protein
VKRPGYCDGAGRAPSSRTRAIDPPSIDQPSREAAQVVVVLISPRMRKANRIV